MSAEGKAARVSIKRTQAAIDQMFVFMRTYAAHGPQHPATAEGAISLQTALRRAKPPFALQFVGQALFRDRTVVPLEVESFVRCQSIGTAMANLGIHELSFDELPEPPALLELARALARGAQGPSDMMETLRIPAIRWRELPHARLGMDAERVEPEVFATAQIALAIADGEQICARLEEAWSWPLGVSVVRRVERALATNSQAAARAVELAPGLWSPARRAVAACFRVALTLQRLGSSEFTRRTACHAAVALGAHGYETRAGRNLGDAAAAALRALLEAPLTARSGVDPHRLRVSAIVHALRAGARGGDREPRVLGLLAAVYDLERGRCPERVSFDLTFVDLLARAVGRMQQIPSAEQQWLRALMGAVGVIPPGAHVRLPDGRLAVAMESVEGGDPWRPRVLVGDQMFDPDGAVALWPPTAGIS